LDDILLFTQPQYLQNPANSNRTSKSIF